MPRAGLTQTRVLEEAERLADEVGLSQLTLAALAARLGVRQPSLYKHIDGMDGLQRGLAVRAKNELANILARAAIGRERGDAITAIGHAYREWAHEHPGRYAAAQPAPAPDDAEDIAASQAVVSVTTAVLAGYRSPAVIAMLDVLGEIVPGWEAGRLEPTAAMAWPARR